MRDGAELNNIGSFDVRPPGKRGEGVVVGMSGGVDSSVAAWLLKKSGYRVTGVTFKFLCAGCVKGVPGGRDDIVSRASGISQSLGIEHRVVDVSEIFQKKVIDSFVKEYHAGRTPNPCVTCNEMIKFPSMAAVADSLGIRMIATGHYSRLTRDGKGRVFLGRAVEPVKDQTYFLYRVPVNLLKRSIFPLAKMRKEQVRAFAADLGLKTRTGKESQDICFVSKGDLAGFLCAYIEPAEGDIVDEDRNLIGRHKGIFRYTVGQRKGLGISGKAPMYVKEIDPVNNRIVLSEDGSLLTDTVVFSNLKLRFREPAVPLSAKVRYSNEPSPLNRITRGGGQCTVVFEKNQRAVTPGQSLVLYQEETVVGGGIITDSWKQK